MRRLSLVLKSTPFRYSSLLGLGVMLTQTVGAQAPANPANPAAPGGVELPADTFTANAMAREGLEAFDRGEYKGAVEKLTPYCAYQEKLNITDGYDNILFCLGYANFVEKAFDKSVEYLNKYMAKYPTGPLAVDVAMTLGKAYFFAKKYNESIGQFVKLKGNPAKKEEVLPMLAEVYRASDQGGEALKVLEEFLVTGYNSTDRINAALILAGMYLDAGQTEKGIQVIEKIKASPSSADFVIILNGKALTTANQLLQETPETALRAFQAVRWKKEVVKLQSARLEVLNLKIAEWKKARTTAKGPAASQYEEWANQGQARLDQLKTMVAEVEKEENYDATLVYSIARCYSLLKRHWEAELAFRTVVEKFPTFANAGDAKLGHILSLISLKRNEEALKEAWVFMEKYPKHKDISTVSEMIVGMAIDNKDFDAAKKAVDTIFKTVAEPPNKPRLLLLSTMVDFENYDFLKAREGLDKLRKEFPNDEAREEVDYRYALSYFFSNDQDNTLKYLGEFLEKYPNSQLVPDARYRVNLIKYGIAMAAKKAAEKKRDNEFKSNFNDVIEDVKKTIEKYPEAINLGELYALIGDCYDQMSFEEAKALGLEDDSTGNTPEHLSAEAYRDAVLKSGTDNVEVRDYSLEQSKNKLQGLGRYVDIQKMYRTLIDKYPTSADRLKWLNEETRAIARQGTTLEERAEKKQEVKKVLAKEIMLNINRPNKEGVELLLEQLAGSCVPKRKPRPAVKLDDKGQPIAAPAPTEPEKDPLDEGVAELEGLLSGKLNTTGKARIAYAKYLLMAQVPGMPDPANPRKRLDREPDRVKLLDQIATDFKAEDFSSSLLAVIGDHLKARGMNEKAVTFYNRLIQFFPKSDYLDFGYVGLADIAMQEKNFTEAQEKYKHAIDKLPGIKYPNALLGYSRTLIEQKNYVEPEAKLEEVIGVKEWKGPLHAEALFLLGECNRLNGNFPKAVNFYGRIFLSYAKFEEWAIKGYLGAELAHQALGEKKQAENALREAKEYLVKRKLDQSPLMDSVKNRAKERGLAL